jgi:hypothetical protein
VPSRLVREIDQALVLPWGGTVEATIFGSTDPATIASRVDAACREVFGTALDDGFLYAVSVGCVFGCVLADGRRVVVKAYQPRWTPPFLTAVRRAQRHLHAHGVPCPEPLGDVATVDGITFVAETELPDPGTTVVRPEWATVSACGLGQVVRTCRSLDEPALAPHPLGVPTGQQFPEPHSPIFDFAATARGAEWIDELARRANDVCARDPSPAVIAHTDWSARNVRLSADGVLAVYDWDSLALVKESEAIGMAAATWSKLGEPNDGTPSAEEVDGYIDAYDAACEHRLTTEQRRAARAAAVRTMAYTARCEHVIDPDEREWTTTRPRLRSDAERLLA